MMAASNLKIEQFFQIAHDFQRSIARVRASVTQKGRIPIAVLWPRNRNAGDVLAFWVFLNLRHYELLELADRNLFFHRSNALSAGSSNMRNLSRPFQKSRSDLSLGQASQNLRTQNTSGLSAPANQT